MRLPKIQKVANLRVADLKVHHRQVANDKKKSSCIVIPPSSHACRMLVYLSGVSFIALMTSNICLLAFIVYFDLVCWSNFLCSAIDRQCIRVKGQTKSFATLLLRP